MNSRVLLAFQLIVCTALLASAADAIAPIPRRIPPPGIAIPAEVRERIQSQLDATKKRLDVAKDRELLADVEIYVKAVELALRHGEFYNKNEIPRADAALKQANKRLDQLATDNTPWTTQHGLVVRGYRSPIDDSAQPYGLEIPNGLDLAKPVPLYVWLHGRGDKTTDLHFIHQRQTRPGRIAPPGAIVVHPFGRHCMGFKSAGEIDVLDVVDHVSSQYKIDADRVVLMGFSMGGAGAWHLGAHYADRWVAMSPGAGFAETARYNSLKKEDYPPWYEQKLWGLYDVPAYTRNLFNLPVVAYSGENDKQIQAARVMEEAFIDHGRKLTHIIGPGMGHKYHPDSLAEIMKRMDAEVKKGLNRTPTSISLQTRTLRYNRVHWLTVLGLEQHWQDARVDANVGNATIRVTTTNVTSLAIDRPIYLTGMRVVIDDQELITPKPQSKDNVPSLIKASNRWQWNENSATAAKGLRKTSGRQGPIDDAFLDRFLVVTPSGSASKHPRVKQWVRFELQHFVDRWRALYRGEVRAKQAADVTAEDIIHNHLILWGDPNSNAIIARIVDRLPIDWDKNALRVGKKTYDAKTHVPVLIYPNPENSVRYVVINSGPTHREGHDRTNSLQNPKLPDWAVIDIRQPPDAFAPGRVVDADFFDEKWELRARRK